MIFALQNHVNITSWNPLTRYERFSFPQPFSTPQRIFLRVILMYRISFIALRHGVLLPAGRLGVFHVMRLRCNYERATASEALRLWMSRELIITFPCQ